MSERHHVSVYMRFIQLDVVIPEEHVWVFMAAFGKAFAVGNSEGGESLKAVDGYHEHPSGWHIQVSVWDGDESRFYDFLRLFCAARGLSFREPEAKPAA